MSHASTAAASSVGATATNDEHHREDLLANACANLAIVLCAFAIWSTYSPLTVPNRYVTVTHVRHLTQLGSTQIPVPLSASNITSLGLDDGETFLVLFPRYWQTAAWSHIVVRFDRYPFDRVTGIDLHFHRAKLRTLAWVGDRLILDATFNETMVRFEHLLVPCAGARTTLGFAFLKLTDGRWDEAVVVRASQLIKSFPLVKIDAALWLAGMPSAVDQWQGRVRHTGDIPGNVSLFRSSNDSWKSEVD